MKRLLAILLAAVLLVFVPVRAVAQDEAVEGSVEITSPTVVEEGWDFYIGDPSVASILAVEEKELGVGTLLDFLTYRTDLGPLQNVDPTASGAFYHITDAEYLGLALTVDVSSIPSYLIAKGVGFIFGERVGDAVGGVTVVEAGGIFGRKIAGDEEARDWRGDVLIAAGIEVEVKW